jgi:hypothetical protein
VADTRWANRYNYFVREALPAWQDTARKKTRTLHCGPGHHPAVAPAPRRPPRKEQDTMKRLLLALATLTLLAGCAPEVGSKAWCEAMQAKPKGDWTANEAADYAKHCLFK